jgi:hypothetical protein
MADQTAEAPEDMAAQAEVGTEGTGPESQTAGTAPQPTI